MLKKLMWGGVLFASLTALVCFGPTPFSYVRTWVASWKKSAEANVPLDLKIKHAREEVDRLGPEIRKCMQLIAEQQVEVEQLQQNIADRRRELQHQKTALLRLRNDLKRGENTYVYAGQTYRASEVRQDLVLRFDRYRTLEASLKRDETILAAKQKSLKANERRLEEMLAAKKQLEVQLEQLEARWKTLQASQAGSELRFDDSQLARTKALIRRISKELDVRDKMLAAEGKVSGLIPVDRKPAEIPVSDITRQIDEHFGDTGQTDRKAGDGNTPVTTAEKPKQGGL